ncbi:hypothetical protein EJ73_02039 [Hoylesella shahii DSM 15611 = JCM 12083]|uniref:Tetratricopeptide repeat protein n=2 Tax=Hoylesella shahii TaxID=228603 RepID=A0A318HRC5_9BACT|nr:hypothetical protein EJ73_02039 [Hoylesella shahii DSM 15611 = JCM 12083]
MEQTAQTMNLTQLVNHPELLDKETLYDLRSIVALHPYYQPARLMMLQNLYILHDPTFDEELKRASVYLTNRNVVFEMIEASHYKLKTEERRTKQIQQTDGNESRTISLIDNFLDSLPVDKTQETQKPHRKPTPADAAIDYVSYLIEVESEEQEVQQDTPQLKGQTLIDNFIYNEGGKMQLKDEPEFMPVVDDNTSTETTQGTDGYFTETLAKIYIRQGKFEKALEIIRRLNLNYPKKNVYFADQIRFLEKLIINNNNK